MKAYVDVPEGYTRFDLLSAVRERREAVTPGTAGWYIWIAMLHAVSDPEWLQGTSDYVYLNDGLTVREYAQRFLIALPGTSVVEAK